MSLRLIHAPTRTVAIASSLVLVLAFTIDAVTPQEFSDAVCYCLAISLATLTNSRRLTFNLLAGALVLNIPAAIIDAAADGFNWNVLGLENRVLSMLSIGLVGMLTLAVQVRIENQRLVKELAARNAELAERQEVISELVDAISHDLRTPLAALSITMEHAAAGAYGELPADYASVLRDSRVSIDDLHQLAETLLLVARFEDTGLDPHREPVHLAKTISELLSEFRASAQARGIMLVANVNDDATVIAARGDLRRAIANLLANALSYTPRGGRVDVNISRHDGQAEIIVADDGYGIHPDLRERLFDRGSRGSGVGTGLGLYIVRRVAEAAGGTAQYDAQEKRGSIFRLSLPEAGQCG
jgi:signal transduction histidine kinase